MFRRFLPTEYEHNAYDIHYEALYEQGFRGIIFDIDNTLVEHDAPANLRSVELIGRLHDIGFRTMVVSNNKVHRVKSFCDVVRTPYLYKAAKPSTKGYLRAVREMGCERDQVICIGDQLFTDIWGANRAGIRSILVEPISKKEKLQIVLKRIPEKIILFFCRPRKK